MPVCSDGSVAQDDAHGGTAKHSIGMGTMRFRLVGAHANELAACLQERRFSENLGVVGRLVLLCCQVWPGTDPLVHRRRLVAASREGPARTAETSTPVSQMVMVMNKYAAGTIN